MKPAKFFVGDPVVTAGGHLGVVRHVLPGGFVAVKHLNGGPVTLERESILNDWLPAVAESGLSFVMDPSGGNGADYNVVRFF